MPPLPPCADDDVLFSNGTAFYLADVPASRLSYGSEVDPDSALASFLIQKAVALTASSEGRGDDKRAATDPFPLVQPSSFRRSVLSGEILAPGAYCCSLKTDGVRSLLLLTRCEEGPIAVLIDRRMRISRIEVWGDASFFHDSLFDGEIVIEESTLSHRKDVFLVFDVYACKGASHLLSDYADRVRFYTDAILELGTARREASSESPESSPESSSESSQARGESGGDVAEEIETALAETGKLTASPTSCLSLRAKPVAFDATRAPEVWTRRLVTPHMNDGIVFTPNTIVLTKKPVYKWKPVHTVDVLCDPSDESVYVTSHGKICPIDAMYVCGFRLTTFSFRSNALSAGSFQRCAKRGALIFECTIDIHHEAERVTFTPIKERRDKLMPNSMYVTKETICNVIENVRVGEFAAASAPSSASVPPIPPCASPSATPATHAPATPSMPPKRPRRRQGAAAEYR